MRFARRIIIGALVLLVSFQSRSARATAEGVPADQAYAIKVWGADDGLTERSVTDIAQTPEGYLWIGTLFGNVLRFDGTRFVSLLGGMLQSPGGMPERSHLALPRIVQRCRDLVTALDEIVWAVNPRNDSANSLSTYLCRYAQEFLEPTSIRCWLQVREAEPDQPLDSEQRHNLFLAFKEVLTNVVRHSNAREVFIRISLADRGRLLIGIEDDGRGLPEAIGENADALVNLRRRMADLGAVCDIGVRDGDGVAVRLSVPLVAIGK